MHRSLDMDHTTLLLLLAGRWSSLFSTTVANFPFNRGFHWPIKNQEDVAWIST